MGSTRPEEGLTLQQVPPFPHPVVLVLDPHTLAEVAGEVGLDEVLVEVHGVVEPPVAELAVGVAKEAQGRLPLVPVLLEVGLAVRGLLAQKDLSGR